MNDEIQEEIHEEITSDAPELSEDDAERAQMEAIFDKAQDEGIEEEETSERPRGPDGKFIAKEGEEAPEEEAAPDEEGEEESASQDAKQVETPGYVSAEVRKYWADIPEEARNAIAHDQKEYSDKLAVQGRQMSAIQPIADQVVRAAQEIPGMRDMTPAQIAQDVFGLAQIQAQLNQNPVEALFQVATQYGALEGLKARFEGQQIPDNTPNIVNELRSIKQENERLREQLNPDRINEMMNQTFEQRELQSEINAFASSREHYAAVEEHLPVFIPAAQQLLGAGASKADILSRSYDMAISALGLKAESKTPLPDPLQTKAAIKAKSVNVKSTSTGKSKPMTEREAMAAVWDKKMAS